MRTSQVFRGVVRVCAEFCRMCSMHGLFSEKPSRLASTDHNGKCKHLFVEINWNLVCFVWFQSNKPIMEKKRRARINHCLNELKTLILEAMKKDVSTKPKGGNKLDPNHQRLCDRSNICLQIYFHASKVVRMRTHSRATNSFRRLLSQTIFEWTFNINFLLIRHAACICL